jgi:hypothetical protein
VCERKSAFVHVISGDRGTDHEAVELALRSLDETWSRLRGSEVDLQLDVVAVNGGTNPVLAKPPPQPRLWTPRALGNRISEA